MSALSIPIAEAHAQRYEALLRLANVIGTCSDCDTAADALVKAVREVISFDYLQLVAFENDTRDVAWHVLDSKGRRREIPLADVALEDAPIEWVYESQQVLVTTDWSAETRFSKHREFLNSLGVASTCALPLARGQRRLGAISVGSSFPDAFPEDEVRFLSLVASQISLAIDAAVNFYCAVADGMA